MTARKPKRSGDVLSRALAAQGVTDRGDWTAAKLLAWFDQAAPGDRIKYFHGDLARARHDVRALDARRIIELADAARKLGTPQNYEVHISTQPAHALKPGQGRAHLAQRRLEEGSYEYFITKSAEEVVA